MSHILKKSAAVIQKLYFTIAYYIMNLNTKRIKSFFTMQDFIFSKIVY